MLVRYADYTRQLVELENKSFSHESKELNKKTTKTIQTKEEVCYLLKIIC